MTREQRREFLKKMIFVGLGTSFTAQAGILERISRDAIQTKNDNIKNSPKYSIRWGCMDPKLDICEEDFGCFPTPCTMKK